MSPVPTHFCPGSSGDLCMSSPMFDRMHLHTVKLDMMQPFTEISTIMAEVLSVWGRIDVLVNNAGVATMTIAEEGGCARLSASHTDHPFTDVGPGRMACLQLSQRICWE